MNKTLTYKIVGSGVTITGATDNRMLGKLVIPDKIDGKSVTSIGEPTLRCLPSGPMIMASDLTWILSLKARAKRSNAMKA